ncbi:MAG: DUF192 domain-containing protein [Deltaproteobacteria bacterium]|nr:DUF192 domain-containing protein [Deltaproteobacteria bacterium]
MKVLRANNKEIIVANLNIADSFFSRLKGLLGTKKLPEDTGLLLNPCQSVHTFFMNYPIDVIFLDKKNNIVGFEKNMKPYRVSKFYVKAHKALESNVGLIDSKCLKIGDLLEIEDYEKACC